MLIVQLLLTIFVHSLGRVLNMAFGWATVMLFGRVPQARQNFLSIVALGSILWLIAVVGIALPSVATFLLAFVSLPEWVDTRWIRIAMLTGAVFIPLLVGEAAIRAVDPDRQARGAARITSALLSGYRFSFGIALSLVALMLIAPVLWSRNFLRRWMTRHVPVIVRRRDYAQVLDDVQRALNAGGIPADRARIRGLLRLPTSILAFVAGGRIQALDAETARLSSAHVEILLYPFDLVISGEPAKVSRAQAIAAEHLPRTRAFMTWTEQGNALEDRLKRLWTRVKSDASDPHHGGGSITEMMDELEGFSRELRSTGVPYEEWEVLVREALMLERDLLRRLMEDNTVVRRSREAREAIRGA
jgi:hypothetical protein